LRKLEHILAAITLMTLIAAWIIGWQRSNEDVEQIIQQNYPEAISLKLLTEDIYACTSPSTASTEFFVVGESSGFGGPMQMLILFDSTGIIGDVIPVEHKETVAFFQKIRANGLLNSFKGFNCQSESTYLDEVDVISGATFTSHAVINTVRDASDKLAYEIWSIPPKEVPSVKFTFGLKEITLLVLFLVSLAIYNYRFRYKKQLRWISMVLSFIILGFITTTMMSIVNINSLLMLYLPDITVHVAWYLLIFMLFAPILFHKKNYYCGTICPFGATQEFLGEIGKAKPRIPIRIRKYLIWLPRILAWIFILLALISNNPGIRNYEIFSAFFQIIGSGYLLAIVAVVLIVSTFISKPWCNYLCPIRGTTDYVEYWMSLKKK